MIPCPSSVPANQDGLLPRSLCISEPLLSPHPATQLQPPGPGTLASLLPQIALSMLSLCQDFKFDSEKAKGDVNRMFQETLGLVDREEFLHYRTSQSLGSTMPSRLQCFTKLVGVYVCVCSEDNLRELLLSFRCVPQIEHQAW